MLNVELNIAGFRFIREIPDVRRKSVRSPESTARPNHWRLLSLRQSRAA